MKIQSSIQNVKPSNAFAGNLTINSWPQRLNSSLSWFVNRAEKDLDVLPDVLVTTGLDKQGQEILISEVRLPNNDKFSHVNQSIPSVPQEIKKSLEMIIINTNINYFIEAG